MFKNVKKVLFALVLALAVALGFACGESDVKEANKENCAEFCPEAEQCQECEVCKECETCETCKECETCNNASKETCKDYCDKCPTIDAEACEEFQNFIAPTDFYMDGESVEAGKTKEVYIDEDLWEPEDCNKTLIWSSSNPEIATVDANGVVTGVRPGTVEITAVSALDPEVSNTVEFEVTDNLKSAQDVTDRELEKILAEIPAFVAETTALPEPWNTNVSVEIALGSQALEAFEVPADLAADVKNTLSITVTLGDAASTSTAVIWYVVDANVNAYVRVAEAVAAAKAYLYEYTSGAQKVAGDLQLPAYIFGCEMKWDTDYATVIDAEGKYYQPSDDKKVALSIACTYGDNTKTETFNVVAKGYSAEEKADAIMEATFGKLAGLEVNTSLSLPKYDSLFGAKLTYTSQDTAVYDNDGQLVAAVTEAKEVKFTVKIEYTIAANADDNFTAEKELVVKAVPANAASTALEAHKAEFAKEVHMPWGAVTGNELFPATPGMVWEVEDVVLDTRVGGEMQVVKQAAAGAALVLDAQYLRYQLIAVKGTLTAGTDKANLVMFYNIGISENPENIITGTWRSSAQKAAKQLSEEQGKYDIAGNVSYFDKKIGYVTETYGSGYFSGWSFKTTDEAGKVWQVFPMELMTCYIREDGEGNIYVDLANITGGATNPGGNWGIFYVNTTNKAVNIEAGTYASSAYHYADGSEVTDTLGSRVNIAIDAYAPAFVADSTGKVVIGSNQQKFEDGMPNLRAYVGGKSYKAGDEIAASLYNGLAAEYKDGKWDAVYTANDNLVFVESAEGTFKAVEEEGVTVYKAAEEGYEGTKYAPTYAKGAKLTAEQYAALADADKAKVTTTYAAKEAIDFTLSNLISDSGKGVLVNYVTIPANGYAMSWKYQFYGVGSAATLEAFLKKDAQITFEQFEVHPLSSMDAEYATDNVKAAEARLAKADEYAHSEIEAYVTKARGYYNKLAGDTKVFAALDDRMVAIEAQAAALMDADIVALLADETAEGFVTELANINNRLTAMSDELVALVTKKAEFDAKYAEYAALDLVITYDYNGGFFQGFYKETDKDEFLAEFKKDFYEFLVAQNAWGEATAPTLEVFSGNEYWSSTAMMDLNNANILNTYLFTPYAEGETVNANYRDVIEGATKFANTEKGQRYLALLDWVDEATRYANGGGQDFWGRKGLNYGPYTLLQGQTYYTSSKNKDHSTVAVTNAGTKLGAYRFAQYIVGSIASADYKTYIPHNYWSNVFGRQYTEEQATQIYHCTDLTVTLKDAPYREGYEFLGWKFEDGKDAVITGSMFKDVKVVAAWAPKLEELVEADLGVALEGVYYGADATGMYKATTVPGTIIDQNAVMGLGKYAIIVGNKFFVMPKFGVIELGKEATADVTLSTKEDVQVYGTDGTTQNSCGIVVKNGVPTPTNSYGHGALYVNSGEFNVTISDVALTYGRNLGGAGYGYHRYQFSFDAEKNAYVGKLIGATGEVTLKPGDFLWSPETADRFCSGLTDCDGTNGVVGCLSDGVEVQILDTTKYLPAEEAYIVVRYYVDGKAYATQTADFAKPADPKKFGYEFTGWATEKDGAVVEVLAQPTASASYYAVFVKSDKYDAVTVNPNAEEGTEATYATIADGLNHVNPNGTVTVVAGTYEENIEIKVAGVKLVGANASVQLKHTDTFDVDAAANTIIKGTITISAGSDDVEIKGIVLRNQMFLYANGTKVSHIVIKEPTDGAIYVKADIKDLVLEYVYTTGANAPRTLYVAQNTLENLTVDNFVMLDDTTGTFDPIRFGMNNAAFAKGTILIKNSYFANTSQSGIMDRVCGNAKYILKNNVFYNIPAAVYFRNAGAEGTVIEYDVQDNTFIDCGDKAGDWDVITFSTSATTKVICQNNAFVDSFKSRPGSKTDYVIHIRTADGVIDCANNIFSPASDATNVINATGLTVKEWSEESNGSITLTNFATGYVNGTAVYLSKNYAFNAYYERKVAVKNIAGTELFVAVGDYSDSLVYGEDFDYIIAIHGSCSDANKDAYLTVLKAVQAGDLVKFNKTAAELDALAKGTIDVTVSFYSPKTAE